MAEVSLIFLLFVINTDDAVVVDVIFMTGFFSFLFLNDSPYMLDQGLELNLH